VRGRPLRADSAVDANRGRAIKKKFGLAANPFVDVSNSHLRCSRRCRAFSDKWSRGPALCHSGSGPAVRRDGSISSIGSALQCAPASSICRPEELHSKIAPLVRSVQPIQSAFAESTGFRLKHCSLLMKWAASMRMKRTPRPQILHAGNGFPEVQITVCCARCCLP
jgi:hypothetical protein